MMKNIISIYLCIFLTLFPVIVYAQDDPVPEPKKITVELLEENLIKMEGQKYILVGEDFGKVLLERYDKYPTLELSIEKLSELVNLYSDQLTLNTEINTNLQEQNAFIIKENVGLKKIIDRGDPWWKSPILWTIIGVLVGSGVTIGIMKIVKEI